MLRYQRLSPKSLRYITQIYPLFSFLTLSSQINMVVVAVVVLRLFVFITSFASTFSVPISPTDAAVLLHLKSSISADPSNLLSTWLPHSDCSSWFGLTCDDFSARVVSLNFTGGNLAGTLPASIGSLSKLQTLVVSHNFFSGEIPFSIGDLHFLEVLELQGNNFSGEIPDQISNLVSLRFLNLSFNCFTGEIPGRLIGIGKLRTIDLSNNQITGGIKIGNSSECSVLTHLKLSNNLLTMNIPREIGKCKNLRTLLLDGNILEGGIPAEVGQIPELRVLDVSTNSLTEVIPKDLGHCRKLSVLVLTNSSNFVGNKDRALDDFRLDFNAFDGDIPFEVLMLPNLQILWAPRANLGGRLPSNWSDLCSLRVVNVRQNSLVGVVPKGFGICKNITFLDLSSNYFHGQLPIHLQVPCMTYFNVSKNKLSGVLPSFEKGICDTTMITYGHDPRYLDLEDILIAYSNIPIWGPQMSAILGPVADDSFALIHDFSSNHFTGLLPSFSVGDKFLEIKNKSAYKLLLNSNTFNGSHPGEIVLNCNDLLSFSLNLSANQISGDIQELLLQNCLRIREFEAAYNHIGGSLAPSIGKLRMLESFDLRGNQLSGSLPNQLADLKFLKTIFLGSNKLAGGIPSQLGQLTSLVVLDLSRNALTGSIPISLSNAKELEIVLLNDNMLSGEIPSSLSTLSLLSLFDVSFNNLSGSIPQFQNQTECRWFRGNRLLEQCSSPNHASPPHSPLADGKWQSHRERKTFIIALVTSVSVVILISLVVVLISILRKRKLNRLSSLRGKVVVTFGDSPAELSYDSVVKAAGNFSMKNLIGTGGFGSTYKAELVPGFFVAVKRLSIGRFQGVQQFDAEIRTLGRIRHKNLVTLIGYYVGEAEMFLIYNYLSGGNLETFIHDRSGKHVEWSVIYKIALHIAQALAYLHYSCVPRILHRDIKPSNILLDEELNAYLSDFGLARLLEVSQTHATTDVAGTFGYVAPEYATTCRVSDKSDVYSFGIVLLELMSGKKSLDPSFSAYGNGFNIVAWAKLLIKEGRFSELFSSELWDVGPKENLKGLSKLASTCTVESLSLRPSMKQVLENLKMLKC